MPSAKEQADKSIEMQLAAERAAYRERKAALNNILSDDTGSNPVNDAQDGVIQHAQNLQQQNQTTLQNTLRVAYQTNEIADDTQLKLKSQTEQMARMDVALDDANQSLTRSDRTIRGLKSFGGRVANYFSKPKQHHAQLFDRPGGASASNEVLNAVKDKRDRARNNGTMYGSEFYKDKVTAAQTNLQHTGLATLLPEQQRAPPPSAQTSAADDVAALGLDGSKDSKPKRSFFGSRKGKKLEPEPEPAPERIEATQKEKDAMVMLKQQTAVEDQQLDELSDVLKHLQMKAQDMNKELNLQNNMIEHVDTQVGIVNTRLKKSNVKIKEILS